MGGNIGVLPANDDAVLVLNPRDIAAINSSIPLRLRVDLRLRMDLSATTGVPASVSARARLPRIPFLILVFCAGCAGSKYEQSGQRQIREMLHFMTALSGMRNKKSSH